MIIQQQITNFSKIQPDNKKHHINQPVLTTQNINFTEKKDSINPFKSIGKAVENVKKTFDGNVEKFRNTLIEKKREIQYLSAHSRMGPKSTGTKRFIFVCCAYQ